MALKITRRGVLALTLGLLTAPVLAVPAKAADVTVFAAASLKNALDDAAKICQPKTGDKVTISYAASSALAKQIESGAPADIFFSADLDWMDYLQEKKLIDVATRHTLLGNTLVLIAPSDSTVSLTIDKNFPLLEALSTRLSQRECRVRTYRYAFLTSADSHDDKPGLASSWRDPHAKTLQHVIPHVQAFRA